MSAGTLYRQVELENLYYRPQMLPDSILSFLVGWETNPLNLPNDVPVGHKAVRSGTKDRVDTWPSRE